MDYVEEQQFDRGAGDKEMMSKTCTFLLTLLMASTIVGQVDHSALPKSAAGKLALAYFAAFNTGDEDRLRAYFRDNLSAESLSRRGVEPRIEVHRELRAEAKTMEVKRVISLSDTEVKLLVQAATGVWFEYEFAADPATAKIRGFGFDRTTPPADAAKAAPSYNAPTNRSELIASTERMLDDLAKDEKFSGVVLLAKDGQPILQKAYGFADRERRTPNRMDTRFNLGSINKMFTRTAIGQLVKEGKLSFSDRLNKILPDYPNREAAAKITIAHLVTMKSGIGDIFNEQFDAMDKSLLRSNKDYLRLFGASPLLFEPGTNKRYSNGGYVVLGLIIEKLSGMSYYDYVDQNIFRPAGMTDTGSYEVDKLPANTAFGYTGDGDGRRRNDKMLPARGSSAGGGYSTAADMLRMAAALKTGKLAIPDDDGKFPPAFQGMGIAGGAEGINAVFSTNALTGYTIVVLSNYDSPSAEKPASQIREWVRHIKD